MLEQRCRTLVASRADDKGCSRLHGRQEGAAGEAGGGCRGGRREAAKRMYRKRIDRKEAGLERGRMPGWLRV